MNIETANRLYELRKKNNLSQEEVADKLGISRQSVSKWERAEASPDTDNLILLAKLYNVSLDELVNAEKSSEYAEENPYQEENGTPEFVEDPEATAELGLDTIIETKEEKQDEAAEEETSENSSEDNQPSVEEGKKDGE